MKQTLMLYLVSRVNFLSNESNTMFWQLMYISDWFFYLGNDSLRQAIRKFAQHLGGTSLDCSSLLRPLWTENKIKNPCVLHVKVISAGHRTIWCDLLERNCRSTTSEKDGGIYSSSPEILRCICTIHHCSCCFHYGSSHSFCCSILCWVVRDSCFVEYPIILQIGFKHLWCIFTASICSQDLQIFSNDAIYCSNRIFEFFPRISALWSISECTSKNHW